MRTVAALLILTVLIAIESCGLKTDPQPPKEGVLQETQLALIS